jgi:hypothetical protein
LIVVYFYDLFTVVLTDDNSHTATSITGNRTVKSTPRKTSGHLEQTHREPGKCGTSECHDDGDLLHNLLGVETEDINLMLNSADDAAALLGVKKTAAK